MLTFRSSSLTLCVAISMVALGSGAWAGQGAEIGVSPVLNEVTASGASRAISALGQGDSAVIALVRELSEWRRRALDAEAKLEKAGLDVSTEPSGTQSSKLGTVVSVLEPERLVILSSGRSAGAVQGALVSLGRNVVAKIVESRETVSAALVDNSFKGKLAMLEGLPVQLAVR